MRGMVLALKNGLIIGIKTKEININVWGAGYIGISTAFNFAKSGYSVMLLDVNEKRVRELANGNLPIDIDSVEPEEFGQLLKQHKITVSDVKSHLWVKNAINIICVDTEKLGEPTYNSLINVLDEIQLSHCKREQLLLIESTISATWISTVILPKLFPDQHLAVAPRRDWFLEKGLNLKTLPRVVGVQDKRYETIISFLYKQISEKIILMSDAYHASMVKAVENSIRYINVVFANEMMDAFKDYNMSEVFSAAGTKWNIPTYHPSIGIGGYCLPLAPKYILRNLPNDSKKLPMLRRSIESNFANTNFVVNYIKKLTSKKIGILGMSYAPDTKIWKNAPVINITRSLLAQGYIVEINDPFYTSDEICEIAGAQTFNLTEEELDHFDLILIAACHSVYKQKLYKLLKVGHHNFTVLDNFGSMKELKKLKNISYIEVGNFAMK